MEDLMNKVRTCPFIQRAARLVQRILAKVRNSEDEAEDLDNDGVLSLQEKLLHKGFGKNKRKGSTISKLDNAFMNKAIVFTWPFFSLYLLSQPWLSGWANNMWFPYSANYTVYKRDGSVEGSWKRPGMCDTPAKYFHCTDGQNFTELAIKARGHPVGCGCGQGFLGEGLCPMTSYGYTLSDFVSTEPGIALMLGLGFFPLYGTWRNTMMINRLAKPSKLFELLHMWTMAVFQISYLLWGVASDCIFPTAHSILTVIFLGAFLAHWVFTALICIACMGAENVESVITIIVACSAIGLMTVGAIPRIFLTTNDFIGFALFPNWNRGLGSYAFWFAEAAGLSITFGAYPLILLAVWWKPELCDLDKDGKLSSEEIDMFAPFLMSAELLEETAQELEVENKRRGSSF